MSADPPRGEPGGGNPKGGSNSSRKRSAARRSARIAAVQALYQMDLAQTDQNDVIAEFASHRFGVEDEGAHAEADAAFFGEIVRGVVRLQRDIDPVIDNQLAEGWNLVRIDTILRATLRSAVYELIERKDIPARVVISEYVDVARAFFEEEEPKVVNGILDKLARRLRDGEL